MMMGQSSVNRQILIPIMLGTCGTSLIPVGSAIGRAGYPSISIALLTVAIILDACALVLLVVAEFKRLRSIFAEQRRRREYWRAEARKFSI